MHVPGCPPVAAGRLAGISHIIAGEPASGDQLLGHLAADLDVPDVGTLHGSPTMPCLTRPAGQEDVLAEIPCPPRRSRAGPPIVLVEVHQAVSAGHLVAVAGAPGDDALAAGAGSAGKAEAVAPSGPPEVVIVRYVQRIRTKRHCPAQWLQDAAAKPGQSALLACCRPDPVASKHRASQRCFFRASQ